MTSSRSSSAQRLLENGARGAVIYALPIATALANKAALAVVCISAILCFAAHAIRRRSWTGGLSLIALQWSAPALVAVAFAIYAAITLQWTLDTRDALYGFGEVLIAIGAAAAVAKGLAPFSRNALERHLATALILCSALVCFELAAGMPLRTLVGARVETLQYNRAIEVMALMIPLLLGRIFDRDGSWLARIAVVCVCIAALMSDSGSGVVAIAAALLAMGIARAHLATARRIGFVVTLACLALAPFAGDIARAITPEKVERAMGGAHVSERVDIWRVFGAVARRHVVAGAGFNSSAAVMASPLMMDAPPELRELNYMHPHNMFLQIWVELGAIGAGLVAILIVMAYRWIGQQETERQIEWLSWMAASGALALVAHGAWQGWLLAAMGAGAAILLLIGRSRDA